MKQRPQLTAAMCTPIKSGLTYIHTYKLVALIGSDKRNAFVIAVQQQYRNWNPWSRGEAGNTTKWWPWLIRVHKTSLRKPNIQNKSQVVSYPQIIILKRNYMRYQLNGTRFSQSLTYKVKKYIWFIYVHI